jgi:hypothetical protein
MDKDAMKGHNYTDETPAIEFWEDDCGLSDLARDQFSQMQQTSDQNRTTQTNRND